MSSWKFGAYHLHDYASCYLRLDQHCYKLRSEVAAMKQISELTIYDIEELLKKPATFSSNRLLGIGGSDAEKIMSGDWLALWKVKVGIDPGDDLSLNLPVQNGTWNEPLNRWFFWKQTGLVVDLVNEPLIHPVHDFMRCNLDGRCCGNVWEAKSYNGFTKPEEAVSKAYTQLQHNMAVAGGDMAYLSVIFGGSSWQKFEVPRDNDFIDRLIDKEEEFWSHVESNVAPPSLVAAEPKVEIKFDDLIEVDMTGNNQFANAAEDWKANKNAAKAFDAAVKAIKELVPDNARKATGYGIIATRSKSLSITIKEEK